ncbi:MAG TPA: murein biosynthesis integral membrane protein MurJ [Anaerolineaceae bacterium]|nr:murein biosynthesis integral membrane protein MurJ [Anaerolineaceae bacterium]
MKKASKLTRISLLLAVFFGMDKLLGVLRTIIIGRQFGLSEELDVFNAANNLPDLLFALISGGALAIAFIPVLSETISKEGRESSWRLFSQVANLAFIVTAVLALLVGLLAEPLVKNQLGIAPGFSPQQQELVVELMRLNLVSTLIFSISGLVMAGLQANQHFLFPAIAPLLYDVGQIFGAVILAPEEGLRIAGIQLPGFGLGIQGLVYGVIIGAALHLLIQVPGLVKYKFKWSPVIRFNDEPLRKVLRLMGPRLVSMVFIQLIFMARDNLASRLAVGSVTALSYGWWIQQVPETLIGTAIATALLPTLSELMAAGEQTKFKETIERAVRVMLALSLPITVILSLISLPLIQFAFGFPLEDARMIQWATQAYLIGLLGHSVVEVGVRAFYARQNAKVPMLISGLGLLIYIGLAIGLMGPFQAGGIALANSISYSVQALVLVLVLNRQLPEKFKFGNTALRGIAAAGLGGLAAWLVFSILPISLPAVVMAVLAGTVGVLVAAVPIWREVRLLANL